MIKALTLSLASCCLALFPAPLLAQEAAGARSSEDVAGDIIQMRAFTAQAIQAFRGGEQRQASSLYFKAISLGETLVSQGSTDDTLQLNLAQAHLGLGNLNVFDKRWVPAGASYQQALPIAQGLAAIAPDEQSYQALLAQVHSALGSVDIAQGYLPSARSHFETSLELRRALAEANPNSAPHQQDLANGHEILGNLLLETGEHENALTSFQAELAIAQTLAAANPNDLRAQADLARRYARAAGTAIAVGQNPLAWTYLTAKAELLEGIALKVPADDTVSRELWLTYSKMIEVAWSQNDAASGLAAAQKALTIARNREGAAPQDVTRQRDLALSLFNLANVPGSTLGWNEAIDYLENMQAQGTLLPADQGLLEEAHRLSELETAAN